MAESPAQPSAELVTVKIRPFAEALLAIDGKRHAVDVNDTFARLVVVVIGRVSHCVGTSRYGATRIYPDGVASDVNSVSGERDIAIELNHSAGTFRVETQ